MATGIRKRPAILLVGLGLAMPALRSDGQGMPWGIDSKRSPLTIDPGTGALTAIGLTGAGKLPGLAGLGLLARRRGRALGHAHQGHPTDAALWPTRLPGGSEPIAILLAWSPFAQGERVPNACRKQPPANIFHPRPCPKPLPPP